MKGGKVKSKSPSRSAMGRLLPPVDIQNENQIDELEKRIQVGPITLVLVYADWCGHCQRFKPIMEKLENMPGRTVQTARIRDDMFPKSSISSAKIDGYPTLMLVKKSGEVATFKDEDGQTTNAIPDHTDVNKMSILVRNAGKEEGLSLLEAPEERSGLQIQSNAAVDPSQEVPKIPKNILADRMAPESVERLNRNLVNASSSLLKEATAPVAGNKQTGGGLYSQLSIAAQAVAPATTLFLGAEAMKKSRAKTRGGMMNTSILPTVQNIATPAALYMGAQAMKKTRRNRKGGMLNLAILPTLQNIATPAALYMGAQAMKKSRRGKRGGMINTTLLPSVQNIATPTALYMGAQAMKKRSRKTRRRN
jgi:thiol-disulfide isomerase/thioredoxin